MPAILTLGAALAVLAPASSSLDLGPRLRQHVEILAAEEMEGRMTLQPGEIKAAEYIANELKKLGVGPFAQSYFHFFDITVNRQVGPNSQMSLTLADGREINLRPDVDYRPLANTSENPAEAGLVYVGYGLETEGRNDFEGVDLKGKIAVALRGGAGGTPVPTATKAQSAASRGAVGLIVVGPLGKSTLELPVTSSRQGMPRNSALAGAGIHRKYFKDLTGLEFDAALANTGFQSKVLDSKARMALDLEPNKGRGRNVIAVLPGTDPKLRHQYVIVGAHYDHLGHGEVGSTSGTEEIHCGADDNASGTAGVLAVAEYFAKNRTNRRTLIFQLYSGEEVGLVGSEAWAKDHPEVLRDTHLMVNMDMIGRLRNDTLTVFGGRVTREMPRLLEGIQIPGLKISATPSISGNSDHFAFTRREVPAVHAFTGMHAEYHNERDTPETLNYEGLRLVTEGMIQLIKNADALNFKMIFRPAPNNRTERPATNEQPRRARVGFIPDMGNAATDGMMIQGVVARSPAEKAGIKAGDKLVQFGDKVIKDIEDLQAALTTAKAGEAVKVVVIRGGQRLELTVIPAAPGN